MPVMSSDISSLSNVDASSTETLPLLDYTSTVDRALQAGTASMPPAQTQTFELTSSQRVDPVEGTRDQVLTEVETTSPYLSSAPMTPSPDSSPECSPDIKTSHQEDIEHLEDTVNFDSQKDKLEDEQLSVSAASFSQDGDICRICHCCAGEEAGSLISPCDCSGSMKWVHQKCLQKWVKSRDARKCELCGFSFNMTSSVKPFRKWSKLNMSSVEQRRVLCSVTFHVVAITCVIWSLYVLIDRTAVEIKSGDLNWPFWTKLVVVAIGFTGGLVFMYVQCKTYVKLFRRWKQFNRIIYINNVEVENAPDNDLDVEAAPAANTVVLKDVAAGAGV